MSEKIHDDYENEITELKDRIAYLESEIDDLKDTIKNAFDFVDKAFDELQAVGS